MSYHVRVLGRPEVVTGFALAGLRTVEADPAETAERLAGLGRDPEVGVILVEDEGYRALPEDLRRGLGRHALPMIVPFPGPAWERRDTEAEAYIVELLRQVVGYRVRLR